MRYAKGTYSISAERDIPILLAVRNAKFITQHQIFDMMFLSGREYSRDSFNWRIRRLAEADYISACGGDFGNGSVVYRISRRGLIQLENHGHFATVLNSHTQHLPHVSHVPHSLELNAIQIALTRNNLLLSWKSDVEVASVNTVSTTALEKDYDAIVEVWNDKIASRFALEYERTLKSAQQYEKVRRALEKEDKFGCILYLTAGDEISLHLANEFSGISKRLSFAMAKDFRDRLLDTMVLIFPAQPKVPFRSQLHGVF